MPRKVEYTNIALSDLDTIGRWLTQPGAGLVARRKLAAMRAAIERLSLYPCTYLLGSHPGVRELPRPGGYRVSPDTRSNETAGDVRVLRVYGPGQDRRAFDPATPPDP